jgi:hypothetical protein
MIVVSRTGMHAFLSTHSGPLGGGCHGRLLALCRGRDGGSGGQRDRADCTRARSEATEWRGARSTHKRGQGSGCGIPRGTRIPVRLVRSFAVDLSYIDFLWCVSLPSIETAAVLELLTSSPVAPRSALLIISRTSYSQLLLNHRTLARLLQILRQPHAL